MTAHQDSAHQDAAHSDDVVSQVWGVLELYGPISDRHPHLTLVDDLGFDSLDRVELALDLERQFHITISDTLANNWRTVQDVITVVEGLCVQPGVVEG